MPSFSVAFWIVYLLAGISDLVDGPVARKLQQVSQTGARLDSIADLVFFAAMAVIIIREISIPLWIWCAGSFILLIKMVSYLIGFCKYHTFSSLHTYANKATGGICFCFPVLLVIFGMQIAALIVCMVALLSSIEELVISIVSKTLDRDCKGIFNM